MKNVDIIIPIYNAYDFVEKCIETVIKHTDLTKHTLVLIDDKSSDERIIPLLKKIKGENKDKKIFIDIRKENGGFVKTVNIGMSHSKENDVVLLNSDTEVTKGWIEKLQNCAYSQKKVASVTPLSNNATLASIPVAMVENEIPKNITMEEYAEIVEKISFKKYAQIPTGHGFCMYITREALNEIGLFDDVLFEKGYGEENDFSYRALNKGYKHLICDDTFIYHKGTQSFSEEKEEFIKSHIKVLMDKYPICFRNTDEFAANYPLGYLQKNIKYEMECRYRKNILIIIHDFRDLSFKNLGGTTLHLYDLIENLRSEYNFHILHSEKFDNSLFSITSFFENTEEKIVLENIVNYSQINLYNNEYKNMLEKIIPMLNIQIVHIHHLLKNYFDIYDVAEKFAVPVITSIHDLYFLCPTTQLIDFENRFCLNLNKEDRDCSRCMNKNLNINENVLEVWKDVVSESLNKSIKLIAPSENTKSYIKSMYGDVDIKVIEHGVDKKDAKDIEMKKINKSNKKFNIAFLGGIGEHKGINVLKYLVSKFKGTDISIHLFGTTSDLKYNKSKENYIYHGMYDRKDIVNLIKENNIDLICIFSICPETYCYTLTESFLAGVPALVYDLGAQSDRIKKHGAGVVVPVNTKFEDIEKEIIKLKENLETYNELLVNVEKTVLELKTIKEMTKEYSEIYNNILKNSKINFDFEESYKLREEYFYSNKNALIEHLNNEVRKKDSIINNYSNTINSIIYSKRWKLIGTIKVPTFIGKISKIKNLIKK